jgi:ABC-type histidine transport system ATPase subunit
MAFARKLARTIHFIADGVIVESGTPDAILGAAENSRIADFIRAVER